MQTLDESRIEAQQMSQDEEDHESESVRSDATTEENDDDEGIRNKNYIIERSPNYKYCQW